MATELYTRVLEQGKTYTIISLTNVVTTGRLIYAHYPNGSNGVNRQGFSVFLDTVTGVKEVKLYASVKSIEELVNIPHTYLPVVTPYVSLDKTFLHGTRYFLTDNQPIKNTYIGRYKGIQYLQSVIDGVPDKIDNIKILLEENSIEIAVNILSVYYAEKLQRDISINCGSNKNIVDNSNKVYIADIPTRTPHNVSTVIRDVKNTCKQELYHSCSWGEFFYVFNVPVGYYQVNLLMCEDYHTSIGERQFNVSLNQNRVLTNFDIFAETNGQNIAIVKSFSVLIFTLPDTPNTPVPLSIEFNRGLAGEPVINAIEILAQ